jgi:hypothetical protein
MAMAVMVVAAPGRADAAPRPGKAPPQLLASAAIGPVTTFRGLQAYVEAVQPGAGTGLTDQTVRRVLAQMIGASSLDGSDPTAWTYVLVADGGAEPAFALLVKVADAKTLAKSAQSNHVMTRGGWAAIGARPVLDKIGDHALTVIATQPAPAGPSATVYLPHVLARYKTELAALRQQMATVPAQMGGAMAQMIESYVDGAMSAAADTERLVVTLEGSRDHGSLDFALAPRPGSRLAKFVALQRPSDYSLIDKLPAGTHSMVFAGHIESGPYHDGMVDLMAAFFGTAAAADVRARLSAVFKATTGELAMAGQIAAGTGMRFTQLFGVTDAAAADQAIARTLEVFKAGSTMSFGGVSTTIRSSAATTVHDGVTLRRYDTTQDLSALPAALRQAMEKMLAGPTTSTVLATFDKLGLSATGSDSAADARLTIDAARGKGPRFAVPAAIAELLAASRQRKESMVLAVDVAGFMAALTGQPSAAAWPLVMSFGFADRSAHLRFAAPAATLRAIIAAQP